MAPFVYESVPLKILQTRQKDRIQHCIPPVNFNTHLQHHHSLIHDYINSPKCFDSALECSINTLLIGDIESQGEIILFIRSLEAQFIG